MENIKSIEKSLASFEFAEDYRTKAYVRNFNSHVDLLMETCLNLNGRLAEQNIPENFTNSLYWSCEALILEKLDDVRDQTILKELDNLEDLLYSTLIKNLGPFYKNGNTTWINKMLDMTVSNVVLDAKFEYFSEGNLHRNPWSETTDILFKNKLIYTFSDDINQLKDLGLQIDRQESELVSDKLVGVAGKGYKKNFATGYFRDLTALRNTLFDILESRNHNHSNPIKREKIVEEIRAMNIKDKELSDSNIYNWLINPLKRSNRLGSNKDGYFVINSAQDLIESYNSHWENFKGYYRTLERHKKLAQQYQAPEDKLNKHNKFLSELENKQESQG